MDIAREIAAVLFVFGLLAALLIAGKKSQGFTTAFRKTSRTGRRLEILETLRVGPHQAIHLIRVDRITLVVSVHSGGSTLLREFRVDEGPV